MMSIVISLVLINILLNSSSSENSIEKYNEQLLAENTLTDFKMELMEYTNKLLSSVDTYLLHILVEKGVTPELADGLISSVGNNSKNAVVVSK